MALPTPHSVWKVASKPKEVLKMTLLHFVLEMETCTSEPRVRCWSGSMVRWNWGLNGVKRFLRHTYSNSERNSLSSLLSLARRHSRRPHHWPHQTDGRHTALPCYNGRLEGVGQTERRPVDDTSRFSSPPRRRWRCYSNQKTLGKLSVIVEGHFLKGV